MRVSYVELFNLSKKVFSAYGIPNGCAEDGADVVTWSEFIGLGGMKTLLEEMTDMQPSGMDGIKLIEKDENFYLFDGNEQSALVLGKLMADYALGAAEVNQTVRIYTQNTTRSRLLAQPASYIASRGLGCIINYKTETGVLRWILATPEIEYPVFAEGEKAEEIMQEVLSSGIKNYRTRATNSDAFWLTCTTKTALITSSIRKLRQSAQSKNLFMTESAQLKASFEKAFYNGANVDEGLWATLTEIGNKTLVKATEESRRRGAG